jgi:recombination protein RecR
MNFPSKSLEKAVSAIASLPGIGKKTALRLVLHLVQDEFRKSETIVNSLSELKNNIRHCKKCHIIADQDICDICSSHYRNKRQICVVESLRDVMAIEDTQQYNGVYHILGGVISPINGIGPSDLYIQSLIQRVNEEDVEELIMAVSPTIDGDTTIFYISRLLAGKQVKISTIARGVSFGGELEYADELTLGRSITTRLPYTVNG